MGDGTPAPQGKSPTTRGQGYPGRAAVLMVASRTYYGEWFTDDLRFHILTPCGTCIHRLIGRQGHRSCPPDSRSHMHSEAKRSKATEIAGKTG